MIFYYYYFVVKYSQKESLRDERGDSMDQSVCLAYSLNVKSILYLVKLSSQGEELKFWFTRNANSAKIKLLEEDEISLNFERL